MTVVVGQAEIAAIVAIGQLGVVKTEDTQNRGVQIMHSHRIFRHIHADVIGFAVSVTALDAAACHPRAESPRMVIAA